MPKDLYDIDYLGRCYDITTADPLSYSTTAKNKRVVDLKAQDCQPSPDGQYNVPVIADFYSARNSDFLDEHIFISTSSDYQTGFKSSASISASDVTGTNAFTASSSYDSFRQDAQTASSFSSLMQWRYQSYTLSLKQSGPTLVIDEELKCALQALPTSEHTDYAAFVDTYGTHYASEVTFGGLAYQQLRFDSQTYFKLLRKVCKTLSTQEAEVARGS